MNVLELPGDIWEYHILPSLDPPSYIDFFGVCSRFRNMILEYVDGDSISTSVKKGNTLVLSLFYKLPSHWCYILGRAAKYGHAPLVRIALRNLDSNVTTFNALVTRAFKQACSNGHVDVVEAFYAAENIEPSILYRNFGKCIADSGSKAMAEYMSRKIPIMRCSHSLVSAALNKGHLAFLQDIEFEFTEKLLTNAYSLTPSVRAGEPRTCQFIVDMLEKNQKVRERTSKDLLLTSYCNNSSFVNDIVTKVVPAPEYHKYRALLVRSALVDGNMILLQTLSPIDNVQMDYETLSTIVKNVLSGEIPRKSLELAIRELNIDQMMQNEHVIKTVPIIKTLFKAKEPISRELLTSIISRADSPWHRILVCSGLDGASTVGDVDGINFLLKCVESNAINMISEDYDNIVTLLCKGGFLHALKALDRLWCVEAPDPRIKVAIRAACGAGHLPIVRYVLERVKDIDIKDDVVYTGIEATLNRGRRRVREYLLSIRSMPYSELAVMCSRNRFMNSETRHYLALSANEEDNSVREESVRIILMNSCRLGNYLLVRELLDTYTFGPEVVEAAFIEACSTSPDYLTVKLLVERRTCDSNKGLIDAAMNMVAHRK